MVQDLKQPLVGGGQDGEEGGAGEGGEPRPSALALNNGRRFDWAIQEGVMETANE